MRAQLVDGTSAPIDAHGDRGRLVGEYALGREVGRGTFGTVFEATHVGTDERVAIKLLRSVDPRDRESFKNEARHLADLGHPALVAPDEILVDGSSLALVMPFVDGEPFVAALARAAGPPTPPGPLHDEAALRALVVGLARALVELHAHNLAHLDLKPANILVGKDGAVYLLDFGLARLLGDARAAPTQLTGTILYMAPEQLGDEPVGAASDMYALGVMLLEGLTGKIPVSDDTLDGHIAMRLLGGPPALASLRPGVGEPWASLGDHLLRRHPHERSSAADLLARLGVQARSDDPSARLPFVGREAEMATLERELAVVAEGAPGLALVSGDAGIGKSELVRRFVERAASAGARAVSGRCYAGEAIPYRALDAAIDQLAAYVYEARAPLAALADPHDLRALVALFPAFAIVPAASGASADDVPRARATLRRLVHELAQRAPMVLLIDDAHWGDAESADLLCGLLDIPDAPRLMVVIGHRGAEWQASPFGEIIERRLRRGLPCRVARVTLGPIADEATRTAVARRLRPERVGERFANLAADERAFVSHLAVAGRAEAVTIVAQAARVAVPSRDVLARLRGLGLLRLAQARGLRAVDCAHDLVRASLLAALDDEAKRAAHLALAEALAASDTEPGEVARHFLAAARPELALRVALEAAALAERAAAFTQAEAALAIALRAGANDPSVRLRRAIALRESGRGREAAELFLALASSTSDASARRAFWRRAAECLLQIGAVAEGKETMRPVLAELGLAPLSGGARRAFRLLRGLGWIALAQRRLHAGKPSALEAERADTCWAIGKALIFVGETLDGIDYTLRSLRHASQCGDLKRVARAAAPLATFVLENVPGFKDIARGWLAIGAAIEDPYFVATRSLWSSLHALARGDLKAGGELGAEAGERLAPIEEASWERIQAVTFTTRALCNRGHYAALAALAATHRLDAERRGDLATTVTMTTGLLTPLLAQGHVAETRALASWSLEAWLPDRYSPHTFYAQRGLVMADLYEGRPEEAAHKIVGWRAGFQKAGGYRFVFSRIDHHLLEARVVLALGSRTVPGLWPLAKLMSALEAIPMPEGRAHATLIRAAATRDPRLLAQGLALCEAAHVDLEAAIARLYLADGRGDAAESEAASSRMRQLGVRDPRRWAALLLPQDCA